MFITGVTILCMTNYSFLPEFFMICSRKNEMSGGCNFFLNPGSLAVVLNAGTANKPDIRFRTYGLAGGGEISFCSTAAYGLSVHRTG